MRALFEGVVNAMYCALLQFTDLSAYSRYGCGTHPILGPIISICTLLLIIEYLGTSMYIGPHKCMSGYVSAYHGVGILLHTALCHAQCGVHTHTRVTVCVQYVSMQLIV